MQLQPAWDCSRSWPGVMAAKFLVFWCQQVCLAVCTRSLYHVLECHGHVQAATTVRRTAGWPCKATLLQQADKQHSLTLHHRDLLRLCCRL